MKKRDVLVIVLLIIAALALIFFLRPGKLTGTAPVTPSPVPGVTLDVSDGLPTSTPTAQNVPDFDGAQAFLQITVGQTPLAPYPLIGQGELTLPQKDGVENVIHYTPRGFVMHSSTCDGQDCVDQGEVTLENMNSRVLMNSVVCLPNQVSLALLTPQEAKNYWEMYYGLQ